MNHSFPLLHQGDTFEVHVRRRIIVKITKLVGGIVPLDISFFDLPVELQETIIDRISDFYDEP